MAEARQKSEWNRTALLCATVWNLWSDRKKTVQDFHPMEIGAPETHPQKLTDEERRRRFYFFVEHFAKPPPGGKQG